MGRPYLAWLSGFCLLFGNLPAWHETSQVEFVYYGHANRKAVGKCACDVTGGPTYTVDLVGEASNVGFRLDRGLLNFGRVLHSACEERDLYIVNTGRVAFPFRVLLDRLTRPGVVEVHPATGVVHAGEEKKKDSNKARIVVRVAGWTWVVGEREGEFDRVGTETPFCCNRFYFIRTLS